MEKEFIPYEQSLDLKELEFDEPCLGRYDSLKVLVTISRPNSNSYYKDSVPSFLAAPLYQQAFRFFRETYDLDSFVKHVYKSTIKVGYYFGIDKYKGVEFQTDFDAWYNTHEEAELECLKKLIEIVKQKRKI